MKRIKLMLVSLSVLGVVGAALAFNVKGTTKFCTFEVGQGGSCSNVACPNFNTKGIKTDNTGLFVCTTTTSGVASSPCTNRNCTTNAPVQYLDNQ